MTGVTLVDLLARSAAEHEDREAIVTVDARMRYGPLWEAVQRGAAALVSRGIEPGDRVALLARRSAESAACYYAVLAAGAVVVPLDVEATPYELAGRIAHSGARLVIGDAPPAVLGRIAPALPVETIGAADVTVRRPDLQVRHQHAGPEDLQVRPSADTLATIVYTSGTTRAPKGVMLTHANLVSNALAVIEYLQLIPGDRVMSPLPIFYAYGNSVLHTHLITGATVVFGDIAFAQRTVDQMTRERVTGFSGVPWMFSTLLARTTFAGGSRTVPTLRYLTQAGAAMPPADVARVAVACPRVDFFAMYGLTEATSRLTYLPPAERLDRPGSVGRPIRGAAIEIRRPDGSSAPPGEAGDVYAAGPGVMAGYWRDPDGTRSAVVTDARGTWLRTGDCGCLDADGYLYLHGRQAEMIKVAGHRVSPGEVEEAARLLPGVHEAMAIGAPDDLFGAVVHLLVVRDPGAAIGAPEILAHCRRHLSVYKCPRVVRFVPTLPRTASGKVRRLAGRAMLEAVR